MAMVAVDDLIEVALTLRTAFSGLASAGLGSIPRRPPAVDRGRLARAGQRLRRLRGGQTPPPRPDPRTAGDRLPRRCRLPLRGPAGPGAPPASCDRKPEPSRRRPRRLRPDAPQALRRRPDLHSPLVRRCWRTSASSWTPHLSECSFASEARCRCPCPRRAVYLLGEILEGLGDHAPTAAIEAAVRYQLLRQASDGADPASIARLAHDLARSRSTRPPNTALAS